MVVMVTTTALVVLLMVVMVTTTALVVLLMVVMVTATAVMIMMVVLMLFLHLCQLRCQGGLALQGSHQLLAGQIAPGSGDDGGLLVMLAQQGHSSIQLGLRHGIGTGQDNRGSGLDLVVVEFTEVLHVDLHLAGIHNCHSVAQGDLLVGDLLHCADNIRQLAHAGGLDHNAVGVILFDHLGQRFAEVTHQGAADAAGVHLGDVDASILQETAVNADLAKLVFDEDQLLACIGLLDHFLNEGSLACAQKAGININFHRKHLPLFYSLSISIALNFSVGKEIFYFSSTPFDCM